MNPPSKSLTVLFNPFFYVAGLQALGLGMAAIGLASLIGWWGHTHFDGVLDTHTGAAAPLWLFFAEGVIDWLCLFLVLWLGGRVISASSFRAVDLLGTQALARWPAVIISLIALPKAFQTIGNELLEQLKQGKFQLSPGHAIFFFGIIIATIPFICWMVVLMYESFSVSCNVKGGKAIGTFIAGVVVAEILSKLCLVLILPYAEIGDASAAATHSRASAVVSASASAGKPAADLRAAGAQFVDLLAASDFAGALARFDSAMTGTLPQPKLEAAWQTVQQQAGPFKKQLRARVETIAGYNVVFVTCQFEHANLDVKVVFDARQQVAGLFFVPSL